MKEMGRGARGAWLIAASALAVGCAENLGAGASAVFVKSTICPAPRVSVTPRPDIPPHTLYRTGPAPATPPADVAGDPERMKLWRSLQPRGLDIDAIARSFEVTGCGETVVYVCAHPRVDGGDGPFSVDASVNALDPDQTPVLTFHTDHHAESQHLQVITGDEVKSSVVCVRADRAGVEAAPPR